MNKVSLWESTASSSDFHSLSQDIETDVAIVGGGITGIFTALLLAQEGKKVVVIESSRIGSGTTGYSTGNLHANIDEGIYQVKNKWGQGVATSVLQARMEIINRIEKTILDFGIDCGFKRCKHYLFPIEHNQEGQINQEYNVLHAAGMEVEQIDDIPLAFKVQHAIKIENQAQFNPLSFVRQLAKKINSTNCQIFENSRAINIDFNKKIVFSSMGSVIANSIVLATHTPAGFNPLQTVLGPYREYALAAALKGTQFPDGIFWSQEQPSHSIRSYEYNGRKYLIVIGEKHKTGHQDNKENYYKKIEDFARIHFPVDKIEFFWSGQHYHPADELPYIGESFGHNGIYVSSGFSTNGLIYGPLSATIITDQVLGRENKNLSLFNSKRVTPLRSAENFVKENIDVAATYMKDMLKSVAREGLDSIQPGEGKVINYNGKTVAVYRADNGKITALQPACSHLKCLINWNTWDKSWDCPCHGSRFSTDGQVIEGPAMAALEKVNIL